MVTFELISNENGILKYNYWPEGNKARKEGLIVAQVEDCLVELRVRAAADLQRIITAEELNHMTDLLNAERKAQGVEELLEYTDQDTVSYLYGDIVMGVIWQALQEGTVLENSEGLEL